MANRGDSLSGAKMRNNLLADKESMLMELIANQLQAVDEGPANAIQEEMLVDSPVEGSTYSQMSSPEQDAYNKYAFNFFNDQYENRNLGKFGRLNFEDYVAGLTPDEGFITDLSRMDAEDTTRTPATTWMEVFGEDIGEMKSAALKGSNY